jgi:hypothetical protein
VPKPETVAEVVTVVERHIDVLHRHVLRSTTDPARGLPRFKTRAQQTLDERALNVLVALLVELHPGGATKEQLLKESSERIDGTTLEADDKRLRRRLQGIPEVAPRTSDS